MIYDKAGNINFESKLERVQYNACLAITGAIKGSNRGSICTELQPAAKIVRLAPPSSLFNVGCKFACWADYLA